MTPSTPPQPEAEPPSGADRPGDRRDAVRRDPDEARAFDALITRFLPELRSFVRGKLGPLLRAREAESDVVQSTVREVLEQRRRFEFGGDEGFRRWLFATAMRKILDKRKHHTALRRDATREVAGESAAAAAPALDASPSEVALGGETVEHLTHAFERLSPDHREVVFLARVVGLSRSEMARELGRSEASIRNLLHRALAELARHLDHHARPDATGR